MKFLQLWAAVIGTILAACGILAISVMLTGLLGQLIGMQWAVGIVMFLGVTGFVACYLREMDG